MATFKIYSIKDKPNVLSKDLAHAINTYTYKGTFKTPFDYRNPTIVIDITKPDSGIAPSMNLWVGYNFNYVQHVPDGGSTLNRYYFIDSVKVINNSLVEITCSLDVLMTYSAGILLSKGFVSRNEFTYDLKLEDDRRPLEPKKIAEAIPFPRENDMPQFNMDTEWDTAPANAGGCVALTVYVSNDKLTEIRNDLQHYYPDDFPTGIKVVDALHKAMGQVIENPLNDNIFYVDEIATDRVNPTNMVTYLVSPRDWQRIQQEIIFNQGASSGFVSAVALPLAMDEYSDYDYQCYVYINDTAIDPNHTSIPGQPLAKFGSKSRFILTNYGTPVPAPSSYRDFEPYTTYEVFIPYVGAVAVPFARIAGKKLAIYYEIDLISGNAHVYLTDVTNGNTPIYSGSCQIGTKLSISTTNERENENARTANALNTAIGFVSGAVSLGVGIASANPLAIAGGTLGIASTATKAISTHIGLIDRAQTTLGSPGAGYYTRQRAYLIKVRTNPLFLDSSDEFTAYKHEYGVPLLQPKTLDTIYGFTIASEIDLGGFVASKQEKEQILSLFRSGVHLPNPPTP